MGLRETLKDGQVIPACPLLLHSDGRWAERHQQALIRYYLDAGAGGLAVGVHSTQFEIRKPQHGLFKPVLELVSRTMDEWKGPTGSRRVKVAGVCGDTRQAVGEAALAREHGCEAALLSLGGWGEADEDAILRHCAEVAETLPLFGFYLQPAVGGRWLSPRFWRCLGEIPSLVAVKVAPFNRYHTWDVIRGLIEAGREDVALYTGNDDNIVADLLTPFRYPHNGKEQTRHFEGGLLGQWGVWTRTAVEQFARIQKARRGEQIPASLLAEGAALTDANGAIFDAANGFAGCIPGILEVLRRQGLAPSGRCLDPDCRLSPGQAKEIDRVIASYPFLQDDAFIDASRERWFQ